MNTNLDAIQNNLSILLTLQKGKDIESDLIDIENQINEMIQNNTLPLTNNLINIIDHLFLLWRHNSTKAILQYIKKMNPDDNFVEKILAYLQAETPTKEDILKASYALKASTYDILYSKSNQHLHEILSNIIRKNRIETAETILDIGCGTGIVGSILRDNNFKGTLIGVDCSIEMLDYANQKKHYSALINNGMQDYLNHIETNSFNAAFFIGVAPLLTIDELKMSLDILFTKVSSRGCIVFNAPNTLDYREDAPCTKTIEPILKSMRVRFTCVDDENRRYYCCRR